MADSIPSCRGFLSHRSHFLPRNFRIKIGRSEFADTLHLPETGSSAQLRHSVRGRSMGHFHRRHHHVQVGFLSFHLGWHLAGIKVWCGLDCELKLLLTYCIEIRNLPRHQFGNLQSKMFPAYFSMVGICCAISVASFGYLHPWNSSSVADKYQLGFLLSSLAFNLTNLFVFTPMTIEVSAFFYI